MKINEVAANRETRYLRGLLHELRRSGEAEWVEYKVNNDEPMLIGQYLSALANAAALAGKTRGYLVWGVNDKCALVGTKFSPRAPDQAGQRTAWRPQERGYVPHWARSG